MTFGWEKSLVLYLLQKIQTSQGTPHTTIQMLGKMCLRFSLFSLLFFSLYEGDIPIDLFHFPKETFERFVDGSPLI